MSSHVTYHLLDETGDSKSSKTCLRINFKHFTIATCSLPFLGFWFCIGYSLLYDLEDSTYTSCGAINILPSISAAIGGFSPQREVWQTAVSLDFLPRLILIYIYLHYNYNNTGNRLIFIRSVLMVIENFALLSLTFYDSTHSYDIHRNSFTIFLTTSLIHMFLMFYAHRRSEKFEVKLRNRIALANFFGVVLSLCFFVLHDISCPDYVYSLFAFCEYVVVLTNIAYHGSIMFDFPDKYLIITLDCIRLEGPTKLLMMQP